MRLVMVNTDDHPFMRLVMVNTDDHPFMRLTAMMVSTAVHVVAAINLELALVFHEKQHNGKH